MGNCFILGALVSSTVTIISKPVFGVKSKTEAASDTSCSSLPLEGAGFRNKGLHQRAHLAALMIPKEHRRLLYFTRLKRKKTLYPYVSSDRSRFLGRIFLRSYLFSFVFPVSMTNTTSGIVTPVSAIFVERTI